MGQPKQLLPIRGKPLIRHMAESAVAAPVSPVVVVLGAEAEKVRETLAGLPVKIAVNSEWSAGLSSSLRVGVETALTHASGVSALIICLADQPNLTQEHLQRLIARFGEGGCTAVASLAGETTMPPILFDRSWFAKLGALQGDVGARALLRERMDEVATVPIDSAEDLDTPEDYAKYVG